MPERKCKRYKDDHTKLRQLRLERRLRLREVSAATGLAVSTVCQIELGISRGSVKSLRRLAAGFGVPLSAVLEDAQ